MLVALISYILLNIFLARMKAQEGEGMDDGRRAEAVAKVAKIVNIINRVVAIWFQVLLGIALTVIVIAIISFIFSLISILVEAAWVESVEMWRLGSLSKIVTEYGTTRVISLLAILSIIFGGLFYLCVRLLKKIKSRNQ